MGEREREEVGIEEGEGVQRLPLQESGEMPFVGGSTANPEMEMEVPVSPGEDAMINARMALETQDYAPSGPNNHHKPPEQIAVQLQTYSDDRMYVCLSYQKAA
ncbi:hypothetical protein ABZP36_035513 [Zizania latifolia]